MPPVTWLTHLKQILAGLAWYKPFQQKHVLKRRNDACLELMPSLRQKVLCVIRPQNVMLATIIIPTNSETDERTLPFMVR